MRQIYLKSGKELLVKRMHPWIFSGAIASGVEGIANGDWVEVYSHQKVLLGKGHYSHKAIAVRMLTFQDENINDAFWNRKIEKAVKMRSNLGFFDNTETNCFRLVHGESDGLPGLIVDNYNGVLVVQCHSLGMYHNLMEITRALRHVLGDYVKAVYNKSAETLNHAGATETYPNEWLFGQSDDDIVLEWGLKFRVSWEQGQKTGFFLDQRDNRKLLQRYSKGKIVLNTFCYSGGFSVLALAGGAKRVVSIDSSSKAIELTRQNVVLNFSEDIPHESLTDDVFDYLTAANEKFDVIVLDPPAFAKHLSARHKAVQGYKRLNLMAMRQLNPGGILFTFSCSQAVDKELFKNTVVSAALESRRQVRIVEYLSQPSDHAVSIHHPEGEYLKGLILYVE
jgi:23S rRNA (cytosine1962-C5)-methyltransferase